MSEKQVDKVSWPKDVYEATPERMVRFFLSRADVLDGLANEAVRSEETDYARTCELIEHMQGMWNGGYALHYLLRQGCEAQAQELARHLYTVAESGEYAEWTYDLLKKYALDGGG